MALENVFSWSKSRDEQFRECQRKYYYDKYQSWGGWDPSSPTKVRLAYVLKNLKNRWAWKGETVHHVIEHSLKSLRSGRPVPFETALSLLTDTMRRNYRSSKTKQYLQDPKKNLGLFEHEYEKGISDQVWKRIHDESAECLKNFYDSALYAELASEEKKDWVVIEDLEEFEEQGTKIYVKLDFARRKNGVIEIYDWKTGKSDSADPGVQIGCYAMYAMKKWGVPLSALRAYLVNLSGAPAVPAEVPLSDELISKTRSFMTESAAAMRRLLADPLKNVPLPAGSFAFTSNEKFCGTCNFYKICEKYSP